MRRADLKIELQLRSPDQNLWAQSVEEGTRSLGLGLKFGSGPPELLEYHRLASELIAIREAGIQPDGDFLRKLRLAHESSRRYLGPMSQQDLKHFILVYSIPDRAVEVLAFGHDRDAATLEYQRLEAEQRDNPDVDIVLLGAESEEVIRQTHASYFADRAQHLDDLVERELAGGAR